MSNSGNAGNSQSRSSTRYPVMLKVTNTKSMDKAIANIKYIGFRSRENGQEKGLFNENSDNANFKQFVNKLKNDKALKHSSSTKLHKLVISFKEEDFKKYNVDYKELTRHIMKHIEQMKGVKLDWVAAEHLSQGHPHVHIAVKATGKDVNTNQTRRVYFSKEDFSAIKKEISKFVGAEQVQHRDQQFQKTLKPTHALEELFKVLDQEVKRSEVQSQRDQYKAQQEIRKMGNQRKKQNEQER